MATRHLYPCAVCPFRNGHGVSLLCEKVDDGHWIACIQTVAVLNGDERVSDKQAAWANEHECDGARLWRRDRELPDGVVACAEADRLAAALRS